MMGSACAANPRGRGGAGAGMRGRVKREWAMSGLCEGGSITLSHVQPASRVNKLLVDLEGRGLLINPKVGGHRGLVRPRGALRRRV